MEGDLKEVYFSEYCPDCKYHATDENEEPCRECLSEPGVADSHKPIKFKEE